MNADVLQSTSSRYCLCRVCVCVCKCGVRLRVRACVVFMRQHPCILARKRPSASCLFFENASLDMLFVLAYARRRVAKYDFKVRRYVYIYTHTYKCIQIACSSKMYTYLSYERRRVAKDEDLHTCQIDIHTHMSLMNSNNTVMHLRTDKPARPLQRANQYVMDSYTFLYSNTASEYTYTCAWNDFK